MSDFLNTQLDRIEASMRNLRVMGDSGIRVSGNMMSGLKVDLDEGEEVVSVAVGTAVIVPPETCAGGECSLPEGDCPHAFCITFKATLPETLMDDEYWDRGYIAHLNGSDVSIYPYFYFDGPGPDDWVAGLFVGGWPNIEIETPMTPDVFFGSSHTITCYATKTDPSNWLLEVSAYGASGSDTITLLSVPAWIELFVGSEFAINIEPISLCGIQLLATPDSNEEDFIFPDDSFDSTVGTGQSISGDTITITGDASAGPVGYTKEFDPVYDLGCCPRCPNDDTICVTFADVQVGIDGDGLCYRYLFPEGFRSILIPPGAFNINGSFELPRTANALDLVQWEINVPGTLLQIEKWSSDSGFCESPSELEEECGCETPCAEFDCPSNIIVQCISDCDEQHWTISFRIPDFDVCLTGYGSPDINLFAGTYDGALEYGVPYDNEVVLFDGVGGGNGVGSGGTVTITPGSC